MSSEKAASAVIQLWSSQARRHRFRRREHPNTINAEVDEIIAQTRKVEEERLRRYIIDNIITKTVAPVITQVIFLSQERLAADLAKMMDQKIEAAIGRVAKKLGVSRCHNLKMNPSK